ncbi:TetR/AcrR family transcriptional regulator [uncultured Anaerococcus sp.]|uniref:TetR/AcrR family transcriptional regulator n=1 Tax=uncultured Anaerococcus sp. TaxID=293428 RepID=UPI00260871F5|nr:TetR/AcrR family transcriptional regulator [uncultured Anaerococcus sp.]
MAKQYTKNLIKEEFIKLLEEKSFNLITISEIANKCEINRNTFYYHYEDIYTLVKEVLADEIKKVDQEFDSSSSWEKSLITASSFFLENKKAAQNLFKSIDKKDTDAYLYKICESVMSKYIENECLLKNIEATEEDKALVTNFYRIALVGLLDKWVLDGMDKSPDDFIYRLGKLFDGNIERSLRISESLSKEDPFSNNY